MQNPDQQLDAQDKEIDCGNLLFVDDEQNILSSLKRLFRPLGYKVFTAISGEEGLKCLETTAIDLVISDMRMPHMDGSEFLQQVAYRWPKVMRMLLTGYADLSLTIAAINKGQIYCYISKPWEDNDIVLSVRRALEQQALERERKRLEELARKQNEELRELNSTLEAKVEARSAELKQTFDMLEVAHESLRESYHSTVGVFSNLIEMREKAGSGQASKIARQSRQLAEVLELDSETIRNIEFAAMMRNIGKISLSDNLLNKPLSEMGQDERKRFMQHPLVGEGVLMTLEPLQDATKFIRHQYENYDGSGLPNGLQGDEIPLGARIIKVVGEFSDLQSGLLVNSNVAQKQAFEFMEKHSGRRYDPQIVRAFRELHGKISEEEIEKKVVCVKSNGLQVGMVLARNLIIKDDVLLLAQGHRLTEDIIENIHKLEESIDEDLDVFIYLEQVAENA